MKILQKVLIYILLIAIAVLTLAPFAWLVSTSLKGSEENIFQYPPHLIPEHLTFGNYTGVWNTVPISTYLINSIIVTFFTILINVVISALAAYPLARMDFKLKNLIFFGILGTMMVPFQILMISLYAISLRMGINDSYLGLILPVAVNAFGIFLLRQAFINIPVEIEEAAWIDGCNSFNIWSRILLPLIKPSLSTLVIFIFMQTWSRFMWPLVIINDPDYYTLPVGISYLSGTFSSNWRYIASGSIISILPILMVFLFLQKYFIKGAVAGSVKG